MRAMAPIEVEVRGNHTPPIERQADLTPSQVIAGFAARFMRKRVFTIIESSMLTLFVEALVMIIPPPSPQILVVEVITVGTSTQDFLRKLNEVSKILSSSTYQQFNETSNSS